MRNMNQGLFKIKGRFIHGDCDNINPFVSITQLILNGKSFFEYVETYVEIYKRLFVQLESSQLAEFKRFYKNIVFIGAMIGEKVTVTFEKSTSLQL